MAQKFIMKNSEKEKFEYFCWVNIDHKIVWKLKLVFLNLKLNTYTNINPL